MISNFDNENRQLFSSLIRLHILYHAAQEPIFGFQIIQELGRHGYKLSPGSIYPILHAMERKGYLYSVEQRCGRWTRRVYRATPRGRKALREAQQRVQELFAELFEPQLPPPGARKGNESRLSSLSLRKQSSGAEP